MKFSIVIPSYDHWELTHSLLFDIYNNFPQDVEILVVDDCSPDKTVLNGLAWWQEGLLQDRLHTLLNEKNIGFLRTCNYGVSKASGEIIMLISNDVKIADKQVVPRLESIFSGAGVPTLVGARLLDYDTGWNSLGGVIQNYLEGWFLAFKKSEWDKFGGFDTRYTFADMEDLDLSVTYQRCGGQLVLLENEMIHLGAQTYKYSLEREANTRANQEKWREKWTCNCTRA